MDLSLHHSWAPSRNGLGCFKTYLLKKARELANQWRSVLRVRPLQLKDSV